MQAMEAAKQLCQAIQESPEYREYVVQKADIEADAGIWALVQEYKRLQTSVQMRIFTGQGGQDADAQRFQQLSALLFADHRTASFLMAEMRMQKFMAELLEKIMAAAGLEPPRLT